MSLKIKTFRSQRTNLYGKFTKISIVLAILITIFTAAASETFAQTTNNQSVCRKFNYKDTNVDLNGVWALTLGAYSPMQTTLIINGQWGRSLSIYYSTKEKRNRRVSQIHRVCESATSIVILGFNPVDIDTMEKGESWGYSADNYFITLKNGSVTAYNLDDAGAKSDIAIKFVGELPSN